MYKKIITFILVITPFLLLAQKHKTEQLDSILITSSRIDLPFSKNSRTITVISNLDIQNSTATNVNDLLQGIAGVDIRRRGVDGMQADIYIRGGNFEQTLILIDGIKVEDPQTGHHSLNSMIPLENIERIEIIKGPAARIFGQNAFSGAINIVTKKLKKDAVNLALNYGSYNHINGSISASKKMKNSHHLIQFSNNTSDGYRENTDFKNQNYFLKSTFETKVPITLLATFAERKFGANNFYTNTPAFNEYEETQTSLVGISTKIKKNNLTLKPKIFWRRNQDMFLLKREDPSFSRNFNISNKIGMLLNTSYTSKIGITGVGFEVAQITLSSNNLGNQERFLASGFLEHRFSFANGKLDITPGVSINYFSDFDSKLFPGMDIGYQATKNLKLYWNFGTSYRIPSYTEMYINIPNFLSGNANLKPEEAFAQEIGLKFRKNNFNLETAIFSRNAKNLIDYIKETASSPFYLATNLRRITTNGIEINMQQNFKLINYNQSIKLGYTLLDDDYKETSVYSSRYLINTSIKHHFTAEYQSQFFKNITQTISYRYVERPLDTYQLLDFKIAGNYKSFKVFVVVNNIFNTEFSEKDNVPMPKGNWFTGVNYRF